EAANHWKQGHKRQSPRRRRRRGPCKTEAPDGLVWGFKSSAFGAAREPVRSALGGTGSLRGRGPRGENRRRIRQGAGGAEGQSRGIAPSHALPPPAPTLGAETKLLHLSIV